MEDFINIPFRKENLDVFYARKSIFEALKTALPHFKGALLDIGCGKVPYKSYVLKNSKVITYTGLDIEAAIDYESDVKPDVAWDGITMPFENESFETAFGTEVLEHCPDPSVVLKEVHRVLKPNGVFFFTVPFLWPLHEVPHDEFRYTPFALQRHLEDVGFNKIELKATGGWHASMAQMLGLWVRRSSMGSKKRKILSFMLKPIISKLIKLDEGKRVPFAESQMITGIQGIAYK